MMNANAVAGATRVVKFPHRRPAVKHTVVECFHLSSPVCRQPAVPHAAGKNNHLAWPRPFQIGANRGLYRAQVFAGDGRLGLPEGMLDRVCKGYIRPDGPVIGRIKNLPDLNVEIIVAGGPQASNHSLGKAGVIGLRVEKIVGISKDKQSAIGGFAVSGAFPWFKKKRVHMMGLWTYR